MTFSGPWADLFVEAYAESTDEDERNALADGVISDQEYSFFQEKIIRCLAGHGVKAHFGTNSTLKYTMNGNVTQETINNCNRDNGLRILTLRDAIQRNPQNLDEDEIMVDCLKRAGLVDAGYTSAMYAAYIDLEAIINTEPFEACNLEPLTYAAVK